MDNTPNFDAIPPLDAHAAEAAQQRQARLTKPTGSLGHLEKLSVQLAGMTGQALPEIEPPVIFLYAADHGIAAQSVSAYPAEVTAQMVLNFARGGAVINTLAREIGAKLVVTDIGVASDLPQTAGSEGESVRSRKIRHGTQDWTLGPAMSAVEAAAALDVGRTTFLDALPVGLAIVGDMGIGNTTTAAALAAAFTGRPVAQLVGHGTGVDNAGVLRKRAVVAQGLARHANCDGALETLAALGGLEIAGMAGTILAAASKRVPVLLDGFIATCAALVAVRFAPAVGDYLIAAHRSPEPGHTVLLEKLGLTPLLDLGLRLGEASGAALAVPLLRASLAVLKNVATFGEAGVSDRDE